MRRHLEIRHIVDIIKGIVFGAMLIGGGVSFLLLKDDRWIPETNVKVCFTVGIIGMIGLIF